ncbi:hypothetical protein [Henriciella aquimarina]|uniref:hypothetical protein n=1 Tax=Henriciella aquimarina TaxID=545261 RepID=UPI000A03383B|nr:hypothetical protein [Henriciella aquimarina]
MPLISTLIHTANAQAANTGPKASSLSTAGSDYLAAKANETIVSGVFPLGVAVVVLGCLIVSGFALLVRESRIERQSR